MRHPFPTRFAWIYAEKTLCLQCSLKGVEPQQMIKNKRKREEI